MVHVQGIFSPRSSIKAEIGTKNLRYTPTPTRIKNEMIDKLNTIIQGIREKIYEMEGLAHASAVLTRSNSEVMEQLSHTNMTMNAMQEQLKTFSSTKMNPTFTKRKYYFWICRRKFTHGSKTYLAKETGHNEFA